jgi:hypothetical protein
MRTVRVDAVRNAEDLPHRSFLARGQEIPSGLTEAHPYERIEQVGFIDLPLRCSKFWAYWVILVRSRIVHFHSTQYQGTQEGLPNDRGKSRWTFRRI